MKYFHHCHGKLLLNYYEGIALKSCFGLLLLIREHLRVIIYNKEPHPAEGDVHSRVSPSDGGDTVHILLHSV